MTDQTEIAKTSIEKVVTDLQENITQYWSWTWTEADFAHLLGGMLRELFRQVSADSLKVHFEVPIARSSPLWYREPEVAREIQPALKIGYRRRLDLVVHQSDFYPIFPLAIEIKIPLQLPATWKTTWTHTNDLPKDIKHLHSLAEAEVCKYPYLISVDRFSEKREKIYANLATMSQKVRVVPIYANA